MTKVEVVAWYAQRAGLQLVSDEPCGVDSDGKELWRCATTDGVIEPFTLDAIVETAEWKGMDAGVYPWLG